MMRDPSKSYCLPFRGCQRASLIFARYEFDFLIVQLRPELPESLYYLWLATGDSYYEDAAYRMLLTINEECRTECGFAAIGDVLKMDKQNLMDSFFLVSLGFFRCFFVFCFFATVCWQSNSIGVRMFLCLFVAGYGRLLLRRRGISNACDRAEQSAVSRRSAMF